MDCGNRTLQLRKWKNVEAFNTGGPRGYGLRCLEQLYTGDIVLEMCGEVYNASAFGKKVSLCAKWSAFFSCDDMMSLLAQCDMCVRR